MPNLIVRVAATLALSLPLASQAAVMADPGAPVAASAHATSGAHFSSAELDRLLAPVALYPDSVLTQVLAASTYPLEIVEAARWSREHPDLRGDDAVRAVDHMGWDPSVKALVAFPELLARMDADLQWTQDLGDAFLSDEGQVMDRVQYLRDRADESGHLNSVEHVRVVREREYIYIEPEVADVLWVPYYDPYVVYGNWWWPAYPPYYWSYWGGHPRAYYSSYGAFYWGVGFHVAPSFYFCAFNWPRREVVVVNHYDVHNHYYYGHGPERYEGASRWQHEPEHRHGVAYRTPAQNEQWHRGYSRPDAEPRGREGPGGRVDRRERDDHRSATPAPERREWTVNRAERAQRQQEQQGPRDARRTERPERSAPGREERQVQRDARQAQRDERQVQRDERQLQRQERATPQREPASTQRDQAPPEERHSSRDERAAQQRDERQAQRAERAAPGTRPDDDRPRGRQRRERN